MDIDDFLMGDKVRDKDHGIGTVTGRYDDGDDLLLEVFFPHTIGVYTASDGEEHKYDSLEYTQADVDKHLTLETDRPV